MKYAINKVLAFTDGKKTYLGALVLLVYALSGWYTGNLDADGAIRLAGEGLVALGIGHKLAKLEA